MTIERVSNVVELAQDRLPSHAQKDTWLNLIEVFTAPLQDQEDDVYLLIVDRMLDSAAGAQLDQYGDVLSVDREGLSDDQYRLLLRTWVSVALSNGSIYDLTKIMSKFIGDNPTEETVRIVEYFSGSIEAVLISDTVSETVKKRAAKWMKAAKAAGVYFDGLLAAPKAYFGFEQDPWPYRTGFNDGVWATPYRGE